MDNIFTNEWIQTNGLGGYASSTVEGGNTRRYHAILVATLTPPTDRKIIVAKVEERVIVGDDYHDLSTNNYKDVIHPNGYNYLKGFKAVPFPVWDYQSDDFHLEKQILMVQNENATLVKYINKGNKPVNIEIHPLYAFTDYHTLFHESAFMNFYSDINKNHLKTFPHYQSIPVFTKWTKGKFSEKREWYKNIYLPMENFRGLDDYCDYYKIGYINCELQPQEELTLLFTLNEELLENDLTKLFLTQKQKVVKQKVQYNSEFYHHLLKAGEQFLVYRKSTDSQSVIAGYHWFTDWGRDTMIAMRGLTIATGNQEASKAILVTFFETINQGMLPNRFPDNTQDKVEYNTIDATLWLFISLYDYYKKFHDTTFVKEHINILKDILDWHIKGTRYNIHATPEGFLYGGQNGKQLTWMDAKVDGKVITPRIGCPVEINALWYNALNIYNFFCKETGSEISGNFKEIVSKIETNFVNSFMNKEGTLYDVIVPEVSSDDDFRPNQIYALSLPFTMLNKEQEKVIFEAIKEKLWTPYGLRTLEETNPKFESKYFGNQWQRDHAYHQGTVWPFLLEPYYQAFFKIYGTSLKNKKIVIDELKALKNHFDNEQGLHCISEIFDGKDPKQGKGTIQQAWSISAVIKLYSDFRLYEIND